MTRTAGGGGAFGRSSNGGLRSARPPHDDRRFRLALPLEPLGFLVRQLRLFRRRTRPQFVSRHNQDSSVSPGGEDPLVQQALTLSCLPGGGELPRQAVHLFAQPRVLVLELDDLGDAREIDPLPLRQPLDLQKPVDVVQGIPAASPTGPASANEPQTVILPTGWGCIPDSCAATETVRTAASRPGMSVSRHLRELAARVGVAGRRSEEFDGALGFVRQPLRHGHFEAYVHIARADALAAYPQKLPR